MENLAMERQKLELELNKPSKLKLLFNDCVEGSSKYGKYFLYAVEDTDSSTEFSLFANEGLHQQLKKFKKTDEVIVTKTAEQKGSKVVINFDVTPAKPNLPEQTPNQPKQPQTENEANYFNAMMLSFDEAIRLQQQFNGVNINQIAITLFIQRTKSNFQYT